MLSDFLLLESYYDTPESVQLYEDLTRKYGRKAVQKAVEAGYIVCGRLSCGAKNPNRFFWITEKGRKQAESKTQSETHDHAVPA